MPAGPDGMPVPINAKTWHCPQHEHLAGEGDMAAPTDVQVVDANFMLWPSPSEIAREQARDDRRREARRQRAEAGAVETAERAAQQAAAERRFISELPPGLRP
jgi:hypothetical protein